MMKLSPNLIIDLSTAISFEIRRFRDASTKYPGFDAPDRIRAENQMLSLTPEAVAEVE